MNPVRPLRWHGDPAEAEQPDAGDVLFEDYGARIYVVRHARELTRGPDAGKPHELRLLVEVTDVSAIGTNRPDGATVFACHRRRRP